MEKIAKSLSMNFHIISGNHNPSAILVLLNDFGLIHFFKKSSSLSSIKLDKTDPCMI